MNFGWCVNCLKMFERVRRKSWQENFAIFLHKYEEFIPDEILFTDGSHVKKWTPTFDDILADDWEYTK